MIGVIGANGQVGVELCQYLRAHGHTVVPIVRNELSAGYLATEGFEYRVGDVTDCDAASLLSGLDAVVIAAHVRPFSRGTTPREAREANERLVSRTIAGAPGDTTVIYFSSIAALGSDHSTRPMYTRLKRLAEKRLHSAGENHGGRTYALRLGHVIGPNQAFVRQLQTAAATNDSLRVAAERTRPSNVVHTGVLTDVVETCATEQVESGTYTVVHDPQWRWMDVFEDVLPETSVEFVGTTESDASVARRLLTAPLSIVERYTQELVPVLAYLPSWLSLKLTATYRTRQIRGEVTGHHESPFESPLFNQPPVSGNRFPNLPDTTSAIERTVDHSKQFDLKLLDRDCR